MKRASTDLDALLKKAAKRKETLQAADDAIAKEKKAQAAPPVMTPAPTQAPAASPVEAAALSTKPAEEVIEPAAVPAIFVHAAAPIVIEPLPIAKDVVKDEDPLVAMLAGLDAEQPAAAQLLQGGWIRAHYHARRPCQPPVLRWLFAVACHHRRPHVASAAAHTLCVLLADAPAVPAWVPCPADFIEALRLHGASLVELAPPEEAEPSSACTSAEASAATAAALDDPRHNLLSLLEVLPPCARWWGSSAIVSMDERLTATRWMLRLMLEPHAAPAFVHLQDAVAALLEGAPEAEWASVWLPGVVAQLMQLGERLPHSAIVRLFGFLPPTLRAQAVQHRAAIGAVRLLTRRRRQQQRLKEKLEAARQREQREQRKQTRAARAENDSEEDEDDGDEEEDEDDDDGGEDEEDVDTKDEDSAGAKALVACLAELDVAHWKGQLDGVHSMLLLVDLALSAEPHTLRPHRSDLQELKRRLNLTKQKVVRNRGVLDYHGLEAESLAAFLGNKVEHCFLEQD